MSTHTPPPAEALGPWLEARRAEIDEALERWLPSGPAAPGLIVEAMAYSVRAGGKRLRPLLTLAAAEAVGSIGNPPLDPAEARAITLPAACALEMIHTYSLVHDDLPAMDNDVMRRGRPTLHVLHGEALAILAGDGLLTEAFSLVARQADVQRTAPRALRVIARLAEAAGAAGMVGGQALDLHLSGQAGPNAPAPPPGNLVVLRDMHARKTGALIRAAAAIGAIMAGASDPVVQALDDYAAGVGLAFQIIDDVLDVEGTDAVLGKTAGKDAAAGKLTYPSLLGLEASRQLARDAIAHAVAALERAHVPSARLIGIANWVVARQH